MKWTEGALNPRAKATSACQSTYRDSRRVSLTRFLLLLVCLVPPDPSSTDLRLLALNTESPSSAELSPKVAEPGLACGRGCGVSYVTLAVSLSATGAWARKRRSEAWVSICSMAQGPLTITAALVRSVFFLEKSSPAAEARGKGTGSLS